MELPGIGRSTAGAILALSRGERHPILDGNVKRVLTRYFAVAGYPGEPAVEKKLWVLAEQCTPMTDVALVHPGDHGPGRDDLYARRTRHACSVPLQQRCLARVADEQHAFPAPKPRKARPQREIWVVIARRGAKVLLEKRPPAGIWGGLWGIAGIPDARACKPLVQGASRSRPGASSVALRCATRSAISTLKCFRSWYVAPARRPCCATTTVTAGTTSMHPRRSGLPKPIATLTARVPRPRPPHDLAHHAGASPLALASSWRCAVDAAGGRARRIRRSCTQTHAALPPRLATYQTGVTLPIVPRAWADRGRLLAQVTRASPWIGRAGTLMCAGIVLFSGSIYALAGGAPRLSVWSRRWAAWPSCSRGSASRCTCAKCGSNA